jgi:hypothetical protein
MPCIIRGPTSGPGACQKTKGDRAPEAVQDLVFDAVADART